MSKKRHREEESLGSPQWMTTFSDLMTLLLTFFILLYSFSTVDAMKFKNVAAALQSALMGEGKANIFENEITGEVPIEDINAMNENAINQLSKEAQEIYEVVQEHIEKEGLQAEVTLRADRRGVIIDIQETILFDSGKAELKEGSRKVLDKITPLIQEFPNQIVVEGHTDNVPSSTYKFPTNWELSVTRATTVVRYFAEERNIDAKRLSAAGYGEYNPIAPNNNAQNKALNRRVNILIVTSQEGGQEDGTKQQ